MSDKKTLEEILDYLLWGTSRMIEIDLEKTKRKAKRAITQHLLDVVERAKPDYDPSHDADFNRGYNDGSDDYRQNIIRELKK